MASVDVAVPCYQHGRFLRDCVTSVLRQEIRNIRVLIVDNASTDNTLEVARDLAAEDSRVDVVAHRKNLGHLTSFNEGIDWASSDYFMVLCADDLLAPGCLGRAVSIMEEHPEVNLTYGRELPITTDGPIRFIDQPAGELRWRVLPGRELLERLCRTGRHSSHIMVTGVSAVVRTVAQKRIGYYRQGLPHTSDNEMWMRFASFGSVAETDAVQGIRRIHPLRRSATIVNLQWYQHFEAALDSFFAREGALVPQARLLHQAARQSLGEEAYWSAIATLLRGNVRLSAELLKFSLSRSPRSIIVPPIANLVRRRNAFGRIGKIILETASSSAASRPN